MLFRSVPTARSDFIFLQQMEGYTYEERIKILEVLQEKGQIREAEFLEILGETKRFMDVRCAYVNSTYSLSIKEVAFNEYMERATIEGTNKSFLAMNAIMTPHIMNIHSEYVKPSVNHSNLDMNNRFDRMEYEAIYGRDMPPQQVLQPKPGDAEFIGALPSEGTGGVDINTKLNNMTPEELSKLAPEQLKQQLPDGWDYSGSPDGKFVHIKDGNDNYRIRIDPLDKITQYPHIHIFDVDGNSLDINGNIVLYDSPAGHIPR